MLYSCIICNVLVGGKDADLFGEYTEITDSVAQILTDVVNKPVSKSEYSSVICKKCTDNCMEYEIIKKRLQEIKTDMVNKFKMTLSKHGYNYDTYPKKAVTSPPKKLVLPASKLQPLPPNYVIDISKIPKNLTTQNISLKTTAGSIVTHTITESTQNSTSLEKSVESNIANSLSTILGTKTSTSVSNDDTILTFQVNSLPKDFMGEKNDDMKTEIVDVVDDDEDEDDDFNNDEEPMEIDEECTLPKSDPNTTNQELDKDASVKQLFDVNILPIEGEGGESVLGKLEVLDQEQGDEENETNEILMTDESGSVVRLVVSGRLVGGRLVYEGGALTLAGADVDDHDNPQRDDSGDESQIELQVSGDEETASAIIAAAQEQGGAFIKVESGEMFRVKSVKSQKGNVSEEDVTPAIQMVTLEGDEFKCLLCNNNSNKDDTFAWKGFSGGADAMMQHLRTAHDARLYICGGCNKTMPRRNHYQHHRAVCVAAPPLAPRAPPADGRGRLHECTQCDKKFTSRTLLVEHRNVHLGTRPYKCSVCSKTFASKYTHQAHLRTHLERPRPYKCGQCAKSFLTQQNLTQHEKTHLGIKDFVCNICGKAFGTQHNLEVHGVVHTKSKPFVCGVCGKPFARRAEVKDHMRIHTGERPFSCDICGATFTQRSNLNSHKRATHTDDRRYPCRECDKRFKRRRLLEYHIRVSHTGERPLQCPQCPATFVYPEHFKKHTRIHSGEKPYVCEVCGKSFNSRDNRNTHRFVHSDKKPYECLVCGAGFMRKQLLYAHMNTNGHLAESIVVNQPRVQKVNEKGGATIRMKTDHKLELIFNSEMTEVADMELTAPTDKQEDAQQDSILTLIQNLEGGDMQKAGEGEGEGDVQAGGGEGEGGGGEHVQMVTTDENGELRLVQLHIGAAPPGWLTATATHT